MNLPMCVRQYGVPDIVQLTSYTCGRVFYPSASTRFNEDWNFPTRAEFWYRSRGEKVVLECGSITRYVPFSQSDLQYLDYADRARESNR